MGRFIDVSALLAAKKNKKILKPAQFCRKFFIYAPQTLKIIAYGFLMKNG